MPASRPAAATGAAQACSVPVLTAQAGADGPPELFVDEKALEPGSGFEPGQPDDAGVVLHTSGTTSRPKQVPLRQRNLMASTRTIAAHYRLGPSDVSFCVMPLFHVHGLVASTFAALAGGGSVIVPRRFTPRGFWAAGARARRDLAVGGADAAPDDPGPGGRRRPARQPAVRPVVQLGAVARAA